MVLTLNSMQTDNTTTLPFTYVDEGYFKYRIYDSAEDIDPSEDLMQTMFKLGDVNGVLIKNAVSKSELKTIMNAAPKVDEFKLGNQNGFTIPKPYATAFMGEGDPEEAIGEHCKLCTQFRKVYPERAGIDLEKKVADVLQRLGNNRKVSPPKGITDETFASFTYRVLYPYQQGIHVHSGNLFQHLYPEFYSILDKQVKVYDQMSYFIVAQAPTHGGRLLIFDLFWEETKKDLDRYMETNEKGAFHLKDEKQYARVAMPIEEGDMFVFQGGQQWHLVEDIIGAKNRVTIGGFVSFAEGKDELVMWS